MQTPAEKHLIEKCAELAKANDSVLPRILNVGANKSLVIEEGIKKAGVDFIEDRLDVIDCKVEAPYIENCYQSSAEEMKEIGTNIYDLVFANYVFEHVPNVGLAAKEVSRVLKSGAYFVTSISNPQAPEFRLAHHTPLWFHQLIKGKGAGAEAFVTHYNYQTVAEFIKFFKEAGLTLTEEKYFPFSYDYLHRFPIISWFSRIYDKLVSAIGNKKLMGQVCLVFQKM